MLGLYVAGDTATRELICGGFSGGGSHNAAWAISSGSWAGLGAARFASTRPGRPAGRPLGGVGLRPTGGGAVEAGEVVRAVQAEVMPYDINYFRRGDRLTAALGRLDDVWRAARAGLAPAADASGAGRVRAREAAALAAHARWMYTAALARTESRGMHRREDHPDQQPAQHHRLLVGGLDELWTRPEAPGLPEAPAERTTARQTAESAA